MVARMDSGQMEMSPSVAGAGLNSAPCIGRTVSYQSSIDAPGPQHDHPASGLALARSCHACQLSGSLSQVEHGILQEGGRVHVRASLRMAEAMIASDASPHSFLHSSECQLCTRHLGHSNELSPWDPLIQVGAVEGSSIHRTLSHLFSQYSRGVNPQKPSPLNSPSQL